MITVVLSGYKRGKYLKRQLEAVESQSLPPREVLLWQNAAQRFPRRVAGRTVWASCNQNLGVWARFAYALNARTEYVCLFDDDTIPGRRWLENCRETIRETPGLLGTIGVIFETRTGYHPMRRVGWDNPNERTTRVDIVGHCWFFRREWLSAFWRELPGPDHPLIVGEDIHFSAMLQKYLRLGTYVPPHPEADRDLWGSRPDFAWKVGQDKAAVSMNLDNVALMSEQLLGYFRDGFRTVMEPEPSGGPG